MAEKTENELEKIGYEQWLKQDDAEAETQTPLFSEEMIDGIEELGMTAAMSWLKENDAPECLRELIKNILYLRTIAAIGPKGFANGRIEFWNFELASLAAELTGNVAGLLSIKPLVPMTREEPKGPGIDPEDMSPITQGLLGGPGGLREDLPRYIIPPNPEDLTGRNGDD